MEKEKSKKKILLILLITFAVMFVINSIVPRIVDDLGQKQDSNIFQYVKDRYLGWSGRVTTDFTNTFFLKWPKIIFNIFNAFMFTALAFLTYKHIVGNKESKRNWIILLIVELTIFLSVPVFGQTILWETGSVNYLWNTVYILAFSLMFRLTYEEEDNIKSNKLIYFLQILGIIAGCSNENTGGGLILLELLFILNLKLKKKKVPAWMYLGTCFSIIGFAILIIAPGNYVRSDAFPKMSLLFRLESKTAGFIGILRNYPGEIYLVALFVLGIYINKYYKDKENCKLSCIYMITGLLTILALYATPTGLGFDRSIFGATIFIIISALIPIANLLYRSEKSINYIAPILGIRRYYCRSILLD